MPGPFRSFGRRGLSLLVLGAIWVVMGVVVAAQEREIDPADAILYEAIPIEIRAGLWIGTGLVALFAAFCPHRQVAGWWALMILPAERAISHLWSFAQSVVPGEPPGTRFEGLALFLLWALIIRVLLLVAGWDEDTVTTREG